MSAYRQRLSGLSEELDQYILDFQTCASDEDAMDENEEERDEEESEEEDDDEEMDYDEEFEEEDEEDEGEHGEEDREEDREEDGGSAAMKDGMEVDEDDEELEVPSPKPKKVKRSKPKPAALVAILSRITSILREVTLDKDLTETDTVDLVAEVDATLSKAIVFAYNSDPYGPYCESHVPSFAHEDVPVAQAEPDGETKHAPLLKDSSELDGEYQFAATFLPHFESFLKIFGRGIDPSEFKKPRTPPSWKTTYKPHPLSSPCARFREEAADIDPITAWGLDPLADEDFTTSHPLAASVFQARLEVTSTDTSQPSEMQLSRPSGDTLVLTSQGGYKGRVPYATFYHPNDNAQNVNGVMRGRKIRLDLTSQVREMALYEPIAGREGADDTLVFVADWERIKSYRCSASGGEGMKRRVHTLASEDFGGPIAILPPSSSSGEGERIVRCGKDGKIAVWDLASLPVHTIDASGSHSVIGKSISDDDLNTWRDDPELIERSSGSLPTSFIQLSLGKEYPHTKDGASQIGLWHAHPNRLGTMLTGGGLHSRNENYFCHAFDLERGGAPVARYLGHGGIVEGFSTSVGHRVSSSSPSGEPSTTLIDGDPNVFLTWASDGYVRLYDTRTVLPVLTIAPLPGSTLSPVTAAALAHPSGIPFIFTSAHQSECIKVWDVRAQRSVYELATGNNTVDGLEWDGRTGTLFASTECEHTNIHVPGGGYRVAKIPRVRTYPAGAAGDEEEEEEEEGNTNGDEEDSEEYDPPDHYKCWPRRAIHLENYFGHVFDSGRHRIFQYKFKLDPDSTVLPPYGDAMPTRSNEGSGFM